MADHQRDSDEASDRPEARVDDTDPGDDMNRRDRYQATVATILWLELLKPDTAYQYLYCEHYEDILLKRNDGTFVGVQVKTRDDGLSPLRPNDEAILGSIRRFIDLDVKYPGRVSSYVIACNQALARGDKSDPGLGDILELAKAASFDKPTRIPLAIKKYLRILTGKKTCTAKTCQTALAVLKKVRLLQPPDLPSLDFEEKWATLRIGEIPDYGGKTTGELAHAANAIIKIAWEAGTLPPPPLSERLFALMDAPDDTEEAAIVKRKRLTSEALREALSLLLDQGNLLRTYEGATITDLPKGFRRLECKMDRGGLSVTNIDLAKTNKASAEALFIRWANKYPIHQAIARVEHLLAIVQNRCQEVYDNTRKPDEQFGSSMLIALRRRLQDSYSQKDHTFDDCRYEHLLGVASILTEQCKVWWSDPFPVNEPEST